MQGNDLYITDEKSCPDRDEIGEILFLPEDDTRGCVCIYPRNETRGNVDNNAKDARGEEGRKKA